ISFGYEGWQLALRDGDEPYGLIVSETPDELTLKTIGGAQTKYAKGDIVSRVKLKLSIMPAGLQQNLSVSELVDLVEYLSSLKRAAVHDERVQNAR
ncbi:MAG TPA: hypothetical protein VHH88_09665, partial [Verrucomicrobiae bacterium]|nr:hypothetical protein [Verrucomicrobiae bacterium]